MNTFRFAPAFTTAVDGGIREGMTVDLDAGPRLNYWLAEATGSDAAFTFFEDCRR